MKKVYLFLILFAFLLCACNRAESRFDFEGTYQVSSDVVYGEVINIEEIDVNNGKYRLNVASIKIYESFKGHLKAGQVFQVVGIDAHENPVVKSLHLLFLDKFNSSKYPDLEQSENIKLSKFRYIPVWCCAIENVNDPQLVMYDMLNSEVASKNYLVSASSIFSKLRKWSKNQL